MIVVVADTSPLRYLALIGEADVLAGLYERVLIPPSVAQELDQPRTPEVVRRWIREHPSWLEIVGGFPAVAIAVNLDPGERDAISLAVARRADLVLMDDRDGVEEAQRQGLVVTGTLGVLDRAAEKGLLDLPSTVGKLRGTNFRASQALLDYLLERDISRRKK